MTLFENNTYRVVTTTHKDDFIYGVQNKDTEVFEFYTSVLPEGIICAKELQKTLDAELESTDTVSGSVVPIGTRH